MNTGEIIVAIFGILMLSVTLIVIFAPRDVVKEVIKDDDNNKKKKK